ncbi:TetR/AcrR family transcriptional regulator [Spirochaetota bacterium]
MAKTSSEEKILKSALKEFAKYGYEGARVDRIASRARINKAMIYYHYKGKEAVYETILTNTYNKVLSNVFDAIPEDKEPNEQIYIFFDNFLEFVNNIESDFILIMIREISSGGKYFKKIAAPNLIVPAMSKIQNIFKTGTKNNILKDLEPVYTAFQIIGPVVFFNLIKIALRGSEFEKVIFKENYIDNFKNNFLTILKSGIEK